MSRNYQVADSWTAPPSPAVGDSPDRSSAGESMEFGKSQMQRLVVSLKAAEQEQQLPRLIASFQDVLKSLTPKEREQFDEIIASSSKIRTSGLSENAGQPTGATLTNAEKLIYLRKLLEGIRTGPDAYKRTLQTLSEADRRSLELMDQREGTSAALAQLVFSQRFTHGSLNDRQSILRGALSWQDEQEKILQQSLPELRATSTDPEPTSSRQATQFIEDQRLRSRRNTLELLLNPSFQRLSSEVQKAAIKLTGTMLSTSVGTYSNSTEMQLRALEEDDDSQPGETANRRMPTLHEVTGIIGGKKFVKLSPERQIAVIHALNATPVDKWDTIIKPDASAGPPLPSRAVMERLRDAPTAQRATKFFDLLELGKFRDPRTQSPAEIKVYAETIKNLAHALSDQDSARAEKYLRYSEEYLRYGESLAACPALDIDFPYRFSHEGLNEIVKNRTMPPTIPGQPLVVAIYNKHDEVGAFADNGKWLENLTAQGFRVEYWEAGSDREAADILRSYSKRPADGIVFAAHGSRTRMQFGETEKPDPEGPSPQMLGVEDEGLLNDPDIKHALKPGGSVVLFSCLTGEGKKSAPNVVNMLRAIYPQAKSILGPTNSVMEDLFYFDPVSKDFKVRYTSGETYRG